MVRLVTAAGPFHARVLAARLGADGIVTSLRGSVDGPYPSFGEIDVLVTVDDFEIARDLLRADVMGADGEMAEQTAQSPRWASVTRWSMVAGVASVACCAVFGHVL